MAQAAATRTTRTCINKGESGDVATVLPVDADVGVDAGVAGGLTKNFMLLRGSSPLVDELRVPAPWPGRPFIVLDQGPGCRVSSACARKRQFCIGYRSARNRNRLNRPGRPATRPSGSGEWVRSPHENKKKVRCAASSSQVYYLGGSSSTVAEPDRHRRTNTSSDQVRAYQFSYSYLIFRLKHLFN